MSNLNVVPSLGTMSLGTPADTLQGTKNYGYIPMDKGDYRNQSGASCPHDTNATYYSSTSSSYCFIPSPYLTDGSRNPAYYQTSDPSSTSNALADFDGIGNTQKIITQRGTKDYSSWLPTYNTEADYPAASCCDMFYTDGTKQGDWYLPACGELGYMISRFNAICASIAAIRSAYGDSVGIQLGSGNYYWSSSEYSSSNARRVNTGGGDVDHGYKNLGGRYVRAWLRVPPPIKYGPIQLTGGSVDDIPASGGTSGAPSGYTYVQTWGYGDSTTNGGTITSGAEISYTTVTAESLGTTLKKRTKVGDSILTITMNGITNDFNIPVYQALNQVSLIESKVDSFTYSSQTPASGGTATPIVVDSYIIHYSSGSVSTEAPSSGTIIKDISYSGSAEGASLNTSTGVITWNSRGTTIGNDRTINVSVTTKYSYSHDTSVVPGLLFVATNDAGGNSSHSLVGNYITKVEANSNSFSYANIGAGATSASPTTSHAPKYTFSSGSTSTTTPDTTYGSLNTSVSYSIANTTTNGFTACNSSTGVLTATARGTTIGNARTSATVTKTLKYTWSHTSTYGDSSVNSGNVTKTASCTQNANLVTKVTPIIASFSYGSNAAAGGATITPTYSSSCTLTFSSGSTSTGNTATNGYTGGTITTSVSYSGSASGATVNTSSGAVTWASLGTTFSNGRSVSVTMTRNYTFTHSSTYGSGAVAGTATTKSATCSLNGNYVTSVVPSAYSGSAHFYYGTNIGAGGGTVSPTGNGQATYTFSSGSTTTSNSTSWTTAGTTTYTRTYSGTLATGFTEINASTGAVTASSRGTTEGDARSQSVSSTLTVKFVHGSTYSAGGTKSGTLTLSASCTLNANSKSLTSVSIAAYLPDSSWLATSSWGAIPAGGAYLGVRGTYHYTFTSGSTSTADAGNLKSGLTFTTTMAEAWTNGGLHILSRGTSYSTSTRLGTVYWTYNSLKSNTLSFTQAKNVITSVAVTSTPGSLTGSSFAAAGETKVTTSTAASASANLTFSSGSSLTTSYNTTTYGTWTFHGYTWSSNLTYATVNSASAWNSLSVTMSNNTSTSARSATITRKEAGFTFTLSSSYNNGATSGKSTGTQCTCTVSQAAGAKSYGSYTGTLSLNSTAALSAGATTRTVTFGKVYRPWTWNGVSGSGGNEYYSGNIYLTIGVNSGTSYCSLNTTSAANSSSSTSTSTLSKSSYSTTVISALTYTIYLRMGSTSGTAVKSVSVSTTANAATSITYGTPSVSLSYSGSVSAAGSTKSPTYSYSLGRTLNYTSGSTSALSSVTSGGTLSFSETTAHSAATVNSSTGVVTWTANTSTSSRSCGVTLTVTLNGKSGSKAATCTLNGDSISSSSTTYTISFSASPTTIGVSGGTSTLSYSGTSKTTNYWVSGDETSTTGSFTPTISGSATGFSRSGTTVTASSNGGTASSRSVTYTASYSGATSKTVTITLSGDTTKNVIETEYSYSCSISASPTTISATGGTVTLTPRAYYSARTRTNVLWVYAGTIKSYGTWGSWGALNTATDYTISGSATGFSRSGNTVTVSANTSTTSSRSCTYTISYKDKTHSVTITLEKKSITYYHLTINYDDSNDGIAMLCSGSPLYNNLDKYFCIQSSPHTELYEANGCITVNSSSGGSEVEVCVGSTVYFYKWNDTSWTYLGSFTLTNSDKTLNF